MPRPFLYASDDPPAPTTAQESAPVTNTDTNTPALNPYATLVELLTEAQHAARGNRRWDTRRHLERAQREVRRLRRHDRGLNTERINLDTQNERDENEDEHEGQGSDDDAASNATNGPAYSVLGIGASRPAGSGRGGLGGSGDSSRRPSSAASFDITLPRIGSTVGLLTESIEALGDLTPDEDEDDRVVRMIADLEQHQIHIVAATQATAPGGEVTVPELRSSGGDTSLTLSVSGEASADLIAALRHFVENHGRRLVVTGSGVQQ